MAINITVSDYNENDKDKILLNYETFNDAMIIPNSIYQYLWQASDDKVTWYNTPYGNGDNLVLNNVTTNTPPGAFYYYNRYIRCNISYTRQISNDNIIGNEGYSPITDKVMLSTEMYTHSIIGIDFEANSVDAYSVLITGKGNTGIPIVGNELIAMLWMFNNSDKTYINTLVDYQWQRDSTDIVNADKQIYTLTIADKWKNIRCKITYGGNDYYSYSIIVNPNTNVVSYIHSNGIVGSVVTPYFYNFGVNASFNYQWQRDSVDINGATEQTYTLTTADIGSDIRLKLLDITQPISLNNNFFKISGNLKIGGTLLVEKRDKLPYRIRINMTGNDNNIPIRLTYKIYKHNSYIDSINNNQLQPIIDDTLTLSDNFFYFNSDKEFITYIIDGNSNISSTDDIIIVFSSDNNDININKLNIYYPKITLDNQYVIFNKNNDYFYGLYDPNTVIKDIDNIKFKLIDSFNINEHGINNDDIIINIDDGITNNDITISGITDTDILIKPDLSSNVYTYNNKTIVFDINNTTNNNNLVYFHDLSNNKLTHKKLHIKIIDIPNEIINFNCTPNNDNRSVYIRWDMPYIDKDIFINNSDGSDLNVYITRKLGNNEDPIGIIVNIKDINIIDLGNGIGMWEYMDSDKIKSFEIYTYSMYIEYTWLVSNNMYKYNTNMTTGINIYVCYNNKFPYGRWTTNSNNTKLYVPLDTSCNIVITNPRGRTGNIYGNVSNFLTKQEVLTFLSKFKGHINR